MKLSEMTKEQRAEHHEKIANTIFDVTQKVLDTCDSHQDYIDYMGFVMDEVSHVYMQSLKAAEGEAKQMTVNALRYGFKITEHEKKEEAKDEQ